MGHYVVREAAEDYIRLRQAQCQPEPWNEPDFQEKIFKLQQQRECQVNPKARIIFIDRGLPDGLAYAPQGSDFEVRVVFATFRPQYEKVFLVDQLQNPERASLRKETPEEASALSEKLYHIYSEKGYPVIRIPDGPLNQRVKEVLSHVNGEILSKNHKS